jgi:hypothetical protein
MPEVDQLCLTPLPASAIQPAWQGKVHKDGAGEQFPVTKHAWPHSLPSPGEAGATQPSFTGDQTVLEVSRPRDAQIVAWLKASLQSCPCATIADNLDAEQLCPPHSVGCRAPTATDIATGLPKVLN